MVARDGVEPPTPAFSERNLQVVSTTYKVLGDCLTTCKYVVGGRKTGGRNGCAMVQRPGLRHIEAVLEHGELANYYLAHSARVDMYRRLGRTAEARSSHEKALALTQQEPERQFLQERIRQLK